MTMRIINGCGYNLSGCTAITDFFSDYQGAGYLNHGKHEIGILKCRFGFAGSVQALLRGENFRATNSQLKASLLGDFDSLKSVSLGPVEKLHLEMRYRVASQLGPKYRPLIDKVMLAIPEKYPTLNCYEKALEIWFNGVLELIPSKHFLDGSQTQSSFVILKNDPPGKYPYMASLIPNGISFSSLRDPVDACFDFNRFYKKGMAEEQIKAYCEMFNSIIRTAMHHINLHEEKISGTFYVIRFEDFITKETVRQRALDKAGISKQRVRNSFKPELSKENIGIGYELPEHLMTLIKDISVPWYETYQEFLIRKNMLIEG
ncbi:MAG: hypothetical protein ABJJ44_07245 [Paraglaciecola sp.]|uniref:hypothetical protein n=1 Tax=Paraglaciecola sp. TaxID=1920173 RepID=UPI00329A7F1B